ncbi:MAG: hypothetical protein E7J40_17780, partial [Escherichia coli]|nr:hypothetical protein [Escherichia coli]
FDVFAGKKSAQIREILINESAWEEMTCLFAPSTILIRLVLICNSVIFFRPVIQKNAKNGYHSIKNT